MQTPNIKVPLNYICRNCNQHGHFKQNCTKKRPSGIPTSFLVPANPDNIAPNSGYLIQKIEL
jgi:hypothetical protein